MKDILKQKDVEELERLVHIAKEQGNVINLNLVYMTLMVKSNLNNGTLTIASAFLAEAIVIV